MRPMYRRLPPLGLRLRWKAENWLENFPSDSPEKMESRRIDNILRDSAEKGELSVVVEVNEDLVPFIEKWCNIESLSFERCENSRNRFVIRVLGF